MLLIYGVMGLFCAVILVTVLRVLARVLTTYFGAIWEVVRHGRGEPEQPRGSQPAFKAYPFFQAFIDYRTVVRRSYDRIGEAVGNMIDGARNLEGGGDGCLLLSWTLVGVGIGWLCGMVTFVLFGAIHLPIVVVCCAVAVTFAYLFRLVEYVAMLWRGIFLVCPHGGCHRRIALPVYVCPRCGADHTRLLPGSYGTFRRRCRCGLLMPTLFLFGRHKLPSRCPYTDCRRPLSSAIGLARNLHIPLIGGPTAGKSTLMVATMAELVRQSAAGLLKLEFPQAHDARMFQRSATAFTRGELLAKTADYTAPAFLTNLTDSHGNSALLYLYDAAGELYGGSSQLSGQQFFSHLHGMMLLIDPYSIATVRTAAGLDTATGPQSWSTEPPDAVLNRVMEVFRSFSGQSGRIAPPLAVVLTKIDAPALRELEVPDGTDAEAASQLIRSWVETHGEGNLVRTIDREFKNVRYFSCSALGRVPDGRPEPFVPRGVLAPLAWLLRPYGLRLEASDPAFKTTSRQPGQPGTAEL